MSRDSSVGIALGCRLDNWDSRVRFQVGAGNFSLHHRVQNGSGAHPAAYLMGTRGSFLGGKARRSVKLTTHLQLVPRSKNKRSYTSTPNTPSWRCAQLKRRDNFYIILYYIICSSTHSDVCSSMIKTNTLMATHPPTQRVPGINSALNSI
jgi:hypothetical protein